MLDLIFDGSQYLCILNENVATVCYELDLAFWQLFLQHGCISAVTKHND